MSAPHVTRAGTSCVLWLAGVATVAQAADQPPDFQRDIRPLLAAKCYACHGPDEAQREGDLRLDVRAAAMESGALVPGQPDESALLQRVMTDDPAERMPPADSGETLSADEKQRLREWIADGAPYSEHWAFLPPQRGRTPDVSSSRHATWARSPIDAFILRQLDQAGLPPSPEAPPEILVRRLYLDLIGLPPTPGETRRWVARLTNGRTTRQTVDPVAYEQLLDHLFSRPAYGERWARPWLDLARYSDTNGYEKDRPRSIWPYRDWVIRALNQDMPYDQFSIEQLAGDMLPGATLSQKIATGFHRNTMLNEEGGIDPLEFRFYAVVDRVATTGVVWLGLTTGCVQCHSHKFDPLTHTDYYRIMALLDNADEVDLVAPTPELAERRRELERRIAELETQLPAQFPLAAASGELPADPDDSAAARRSHLQKKLAEWIGRQRAADWRILPLRDWKSNLPRLEPLPDGSIFSTGDITKRDEFELVFKTPQALGAITALRLEVMPDDRLPAGGPGRTYYEGREGDFFLSELAVSIGGRPQAIASGSHDYGKISIGSGSADARNVFDGDGSTGWSTAGRAGRASQLVLNFKTPLPAANELRVKLLFERHFAASLGRFRISVAASPTPLVASNLPVEIERLLAAGEPTWTADQRRQVLDHFLRVAPELDAARKRIEALRQQLPEFPVTKVFRERPADNPRTVFRRHRGEYLSVREAVAPQLPDLFLRGAESTDEQPVNRLQFARWLVSPRNPLAARVAVNRAWRALFGAGLARTSGDYGTQAEPPTHPQLLDHLAVQFMEDGWSLKRLHRRLVRSAAYRQDSRVDPERLRIDPLNRLWSRGMRRRLEAELIRDSLLAASGRLSPKMYGPGVFPPQPASVTALAYGNFAWRTSKGPDRYRRSLYTFSKRTAPFAALAVFDAPSGENCTARRDRSNSPLQALTLLNDPMLLELSQGVAAMSAEHSDSPERRADWMFRCLATRAPDPGEVRAMLGFRQAQLPRLAAGELDAAQIAGRPDATGDDASWVMLARSLMNLDEVISRP